MRSGYRFVRDLHLGAGLFAAVYLLAYAAKVLTRRSGVVGMLDRLHHAAGIAHADRATNAWGWLLIATSVALLVLAISGVVTWLLRHRRLRFGVPVFVGTLVVGLTLLVLVRLA